MESLTVKALTSGATESSMKDSGTQDSNRVPAFGKDSTETVIWVNGKTAKPKDSGCILGVTEIATKGSIKRI